MNTPNKLTVLRIILVPILVAVLLLDFIPHRLLIALVIFAIASITDYFDGKLARKNGMITSFGKFADPLADKILVISTFLCFIELGFISSIPVIIVLFREFAVTSVRLVAATSGKVVAANMWGKAKTVSQIIAVIITLVTEYLVSLTNPVGALALAANIVVQTVIWISVVLTVISGVIYLKDNFEFIKEA